MGKYLTLCTLIPQPKQLSVPFKRLRTYFLPHWVHSGISLDEPPPLPPWGLGLYTLSLLALGKFEGTWLENLILNFGLY